MFRAAGALVLCAAAYEAPAGAFVCLSTNGICLHWEPGQATLRLFLGSAGARLRNGTLTWDENGIDAANDWNSVGAAFHFTVEVGGAFVDPCGPQGPGHACFNTGPPGDNPVLFSPTFCDQSFGPDVIELTNNCYDPRTGVMINAPVFVNNSPGVLWNAYDGPLLFVGTRGLNDIRRVLLHEFGHVLGLGHPDAQGVRAIMTSQESDIDRLQPDDIAGIFSLYPAGGGAAANSCALDPAPPTVGAWLLFALPWLIVARRWCWRAGRSEPADLAGRGQKNAQAQPPVAEHARRA